MSCNISRDHAASFCLNSSNIGTYLELIDLSTLPRQISDAVLFTRNMGVKYLWVDFLCVVQDNCAEVSEELDSFAQYYSNSSMFLCPSLQPSSSFSHLKWRPYQRLDVHPYSILWSNPLGDLSAKTFWNRAWTLQEALFSNSATSVKFITSGARVSETASEGASGAASEATDKTVSDSASSVNGTSELKSSSEGILEQKCPAEGTSTLKLDPAQPISTSEADGLSAIQIHVQDITVTYITIAISTIFGFLRWVSSISAEGRQNMARYRENPWVVCAMLCLFSTTLSFYLGTCANGTGS